MCGGTAGFISNRSDLDSPVNLQFHIKQTTKAYNGCIYGIQIKDDESLFTTVGVEQLLASPTPQIIKIWKSDKKPLSPFISFSAHNSFVHSMQFMDSSPLLASCSDHICIFDYSKQVVLSECRGSNPFTCMTASCVSITSKGVEGSAAWQQLFCATRANDIICYDLRQKFYDVRLNACFPPQFHANDVINTYPTITNEFSHVIPSICHITSFEDIYLCTGWTNGYVEVFSQRFARSIFRWQAHGRAIAKLHFISSSILLSACVDGSINIWNLKIGSNSATADNTPDLYAKYSGLSSIENSDTVSVNNFGTGIGISAAIGDNLYVSNDLDLREYSINATSKGQQTFSMTSTVLSDGITGSPMTKLEMCINVICPLRRIALCGAENGQLYVIQ